MFGRLAKSPHFSAPNAPGCTFDAVCGSVRQQCGAGQCITAIPLMYLLKSEE